MGVHSKLIIKQVNNRYDTEAALRNLLRYIVRDKEHEDREKVRYWGAFGASSKNIDTAIENFIKIQKLAEKTSGKRIRHLIISFPSYMEDANVAKIVAEEIAMFISEEYQIVYGIHEKENNLHAHFAFNPVSYETHLKWHMSKPEFKDWVQCLLKIVNKCFVDNGYQECEI